MKPKKGALTQNRKSKTDLQLPTRKHAVSLCATVCYCVLRVGVPTSCLQLRPEKKVAVGMAIAGHPPHRSVREELPHTALAASRARKRISG